MKHGYRHEHRHEIKDMENSKKISQGHERNESLYIYIFVYVRIEC